MNEYIMNEYSFEYRAFDERGADASGYIKMFPEWHYDGKAPALKLAVMIKHWNMYFMSNPNASDSGKETRRVPAEMPLARFSTASLKHFSGAVDFSETQHGRGETIEEEKYNNAGGKWLLSLYPEGFSGTGKIFFPSEKTPERTIYYTVNMFKKYVLGYTCKISERTVTFNFDRAPKRDIDLKLMEAKKYVPCLADSDVTGNICTLKAGGKTVEFTGVITDEKRFRVTFADPADSQFYLLSDKNVAPSGGRMADEKKRVLRCPFCLRPIAVTKLSDKLQKSGKTVSCAGEQLQITLREKRGRGRVSCCENSPSLPGEKDARGGYIHTKLRRGLPLLEGSETKVLNSDREKLKNILLPRDYERGDSIITTVIGGAKVGKSVFISRLAGVERNDKTARVDSVTCTPTYVNSAMTGFFSGVGYYTPETLNKDETEHSPDGWTDIFNKLDADSDEHGRMIDYVMPLYGEVAKRTDASLIEILQRMPFIIKLDSDSNMTFFDVPGELLHVEKAKSGQVPTVTFSDGLILLVNVDSSAAHSGSCTDNSDNIDKASKLLNRIITELNVEESAGNGGEFVDDITDHMLAVVLCKLDMFDDKFDINSAVLSSDLCDGKGRFKGSKLQKNIDAASEEVERLISATSGSGALFQAVNRFKYRKFFAVSSLGTSDCVQKVEGKPKFMYTASPKRMEHVLQWLLWQAGIIE